MTALGDTFSIGGTQFAWGTVAMLALYARRVVRAARDGGRDATSTRWATTPRPRAWWASPRSACCWSSTWWRARCTAWPSLLSVARTGVGDPNAGQTDNLDAITAVVLGGTSLFGGRGVIVGSLVGALVVGVFRNGLTLMGVSSIYQVLVTGVLVILAVTADQLSRRGAR